MSTRYQVSVTGALYERVRAEAECRGLRHGDVIDAALEGAWPTENPRIAALIAPQPPVPADQRCSLDVSEAILSLVDDRCTRLAELHGVTLTRAELFDRAVNRALDALECAAPANTGCGICDAPVDAHAIVGLVGERLARICQRCDREHPRDTGPRFHEASGRGLTVRSARRGNAP